MGLLSRSSVCCLLAGALCVSASAHAQSLFDAYDTQRRSSVGAFRQQKTLFRWAANAPEQTSEDEDTRMVTDRPHFSEASSLVGLGTVQIETGYSYFQDDANGVVNVAHSFPEPLLRAGVFAEWFEFRLAYNYLVESTRQPLMGISRHGGSDDLYLGAKLALFEQVGCLPEVALFPQMRLPTGSRAFNNEQVLPGFNLAYSWKLNDFIELECNTQVNRRRDDAEQFYGEFIQTVNVEYELSHHVGAFTEWFCFVPLDSSTAETQHYFHGGFVYLPTDNMQFDIHAGVGLNDAADDLAFTGAGFSARF